jgi:hypothetical protein
MHYASISGGYFNAIGPDIRYFPWPDPTSTSTAEDIQLPLASEGKIFGLTKVFGEQP